MKNKLMSVIVLSLGFLVACSDTSTQNLEKGIALEVYKSPSCGCCGKWVSHVKAHGFEPKIQNRNSLDNVKAKFDIPQALQSCHTGVSPEGFFFEGHIPAKYISQFLTNPPTDAVGLAVPGMPVGSPGMEAGKRFSPYEILMVKRDGSTEVFAAINTIEEQY